MKRSEDVLVPRKGHTLEVLITCRISGCTRQKEVSLDDQQDNAIDFVDDKYGLPSR
jgi:hypothetical protein